MENGMEWEENFGMEYGRCSEWNGMEDLKNEMEDRLPYFQSSSNKMKWSSNKMKWKIVFHTSILTIYTVYIKTYNKLQRTTKLE